MISAISIIAIGFFLGVRHATDPDHVIAVTTIVSGQNRVSRAAWIGICWGVGHTLTILVVGTAIIVFGAVVPARIGLSMELLVGLMLIILGGMNVVTFTRSARASVAKMPESTVRLHSHHQLQADSTLGTPHGRTPESHPHGADGTLLARFDLIFRLGIYQQVRPLLVGIVHGLAGSAAVALLVLATIRNLRWAIAYLLLFGAGTIAGMMLITMSIASAFAFFGRRHAKFSAHLGLASGLLSLAFGLLVVYQTGFARGLFNGHPQWNPH